MKRCLFTVFVSFVLTATVAAETETEKCFEAINNFRIQQRCSKVVWNDEIAQDCQAWAEKLQALKTIRYRGGLFRKGGGIHGYSGENCATCDSGVAACNLWINSKAGHREFLLRRDVTVAAVGKSGRYYVYRAEKDIETYKSKSKKQP